MIGFMYRSDQDDSDVTGPIVPENEFDAADVKMGDYSKWSKEEVAKYLVDSNVDEEHVDVILRAGVKGIILPDLTVQILHGEPFGLPLVPAMEIIANINKLTKIPSSTSAASAPSSTSSTPRTKRRSSAKVPPSPRKNTMLQ